MKKKIIIIIKQSAPNACVCFVECPCTFLAEIAAGLRLSFVP